MVHMHRHFLAVVTLLALGMGVDAQDSTNVGHTSNAKGWHYMAEAYMMFPNMSGETTVRNLPEVTVDADEAAILGHLKMGAMVYFEAGVDDWTLSTDFIYMKLQQDVASSRVIQGGAVTMEELAWEFDGLHKVTPWMDAGLGVRLISLNCGLDLVGAGPEAQEQSGSATKTWFDPVVILRTHHTIQDRWLLGFRGDVGGFGVGSELTWQLQANAGYRFSKLFQAKVGYRYIAIDYDKGEGQDRFLYDIDTYGWEVRLGFNF